MATRRGFFSSIGALALSGCGLRSINASGPGAPAITPTSDWRDVRKHFLLPAGAAYCNTGTIGASPRSVVEATTRSICDLEEQVMRFDWHSDPELAISGYDAAESSRERMGRFIGADTDEIAITVNATTAMNMIALGLDIGPGDEIVTTDAEHIGGLAAWLSVAKRRGAVLKKVAIPASMDPSGVMTAFEAAIGPKTKVVSFSDITSALGLVLPAKAICRLVRERNAISVVDGAQTVGHIQVDVHDLGCDYYATSPHKWMCSPKGLGVLYVRREMLERTATTLAGLHWDDAQWGAARLMNYGTVSRSLLHGLHAAIDFQNAIGRGRIEARCRALTARLRAGLAKIPKVELTSSPRADMTAGVTTFKVSGRNDRDVQAVLAKAQIRVRDQQARGPGQPPRDIGVRCGTHIYVLEEDIDRIVETVRAM